MHSSLDPSRGTVFGLLGTRRVGSAFVHRRGLGKSEGMMLIGQERNDDVGWAREEA